MTAPATTPDATPLPATRDGSHAPLAARARADPYPDRARARLHGDHPRDPRPRRDRLLPRHRPGRRRAGLGAHRHDPAHRADPHRRLRGHRRFPRRASGTSASTASSSSRARSSRALGRGSCRSCRCRSGWVMLSLIAMVVGGAWTLIPAVAEGAPRHQRDRHDPDDVVHRDQHRPDPRHRAVRRRAGGAPDRVDPRGGAPARPARAPASTSACCWRCSSASSCISSSRARHSARASTSLAPTRARRSTLGIDVPRLIVVAFFISGALIGLAAATDIQGELAYMRSDWNPAYGLSVVPLVFLARLNALALIPVAFFFTMLSVGGLYAAREARPADRLRPRSSWASCCCSWSAPSTSATSSPAASDVLGWGGAKGG